MSSSGSVRALRVGGSFLTNTHTCYVYGWVPYRGTQPYTSRSLTQEAGKESDGDPIQPR